MAGGDSRAMVRLLGSLLPTLRSALRTRTDLARENLVLRQQLAALRQQVKRPQVRFADRLFRVWLYRFWGRWREGLILVQPETVIRWHRRGFRRFWTWKSRRPLQRDHQPDGALDGAAGRRSLPMGIRAAILAS